MLQQKLPATKPEENGDHTGASAATAAKGFIDQYFGEILHVGHSVYYMARQRYKMFLQVLINIL